MKLNKFLSREPLLRVSEARPFPTTDNVGLEIELENIVLPRNMDHIPNTVNPPLGWVFHHDGSLRNKGLEFVFAGPAGGSNIALRLESLLAFIKDNKLKPSCSPRTSVHVHVDAGDTNPEELFKWLLIYTIFEPVLFKKYAPERVHSNFCVPIYASRETKEAITDLHEASWYKFFGTLKAHRDRRRYSAVNLDAVRKFGSLEFRHMGGEYMPKPIIDWISVLLYLKQWAMREDTSVMSIFHGPSKIYATNMAVNVFGEELAEQLIKLEDFNQLYLEGIRTAQEIFMDQTIPAVPPAARIYVENVRKKKEEVAIKGLKEIINKLQESILDEELPSDDYFTQVIEPLRMQEMEEAIPTSAEVEGLEPLNIIRDESATLTARGTTRTLNWATQVVRESGLLLPPLR